MSVALLGVWPGRVLQRQAAALAPERPLGPTVSEERGRAIYGREGCAYCHTQQVRYVRADMAASARRRWRGRRTVTIRISGARGGSVPTWRAPASIRTDDWHFAHLYRAPGDRRAIR